MEGIDEPGETSLELDTSLEKYPELYAELEAQVEWHTRLQELDEAVRAQRRQEREAKAKAKTESKPKPKRSDGDNLDFLFKSEKKQEKAASKPSEKKKASEQPEREQKKRSDGDRMDRIFGSANAKKTSEEKLKSSFASSSMCPTGSTHDNSPNTRGVGRGQRGNSRGGEASPGRDQGRSTGPNSSNAPRGGVYRGGPGYNLTGGRGYGRGGMQQCTFPPKPEVYSPKWSRWMNWGRKRYCEHEGLRYRILDPKEYGGDEEHNLGLCAMAWRGRPCRKDRWMECPLRHWRLETTWEHWVDQAFYERSKTLRLQLLAPDSPIVVYRGVTRYYVDCTPFSGREQQRNNLVDSGPPWKSVWHDPKESLQQRIRDQDKAEAEAAKAKAAEAEYAEQAANQLLAEQAIREAASHDGEQRERWG